MAYQKNRNVRIPTITFSIAVDTPVEVEVDFPHHRMEGWVLYSQIADCRRLYTLTEKLLPLLKATTLLVPNEDVAALEALLNSQPKLANQRREQFLRQRQALEEHLHDPKGLRKNPLDRLFKL